MADTLSFIAICRNLALRDSKTEQETGVAEEQGEGAAADIFIGEIFVVPELAVSLIIFRRLFMVGGSSSLRLRTG